MAKFVPRILLCGDARRFFQKIGDRPVKIVGQLTFKGDAERGKLNIVLNYQEFEKKSSPPESFQIFLDGNEISFDALKKLMDNAADYIVFDTSDDFTSRFNELYRIGLKDRSLTWKNLLKYANDGFFSKDNAMQAFNLVCSTKLSRVLDVDNFFFKNDFYITCFDNGFEFATIDRDSFTKKFPIAENVYSEIYPSLAACQLKTFDVIFLTAERDPAEFISILNETSDLSENVLAFVRKNSLLERLLAKNKSLFEGISVLPAINGNWLFLRKSIAGDFCIYIVTHKDAKLPTLPEGYKIIHAGHAQAKEDFGYIGDDTGDNISRLNPYLNEITALYWMWKNTNHSIIGLCHYRRFFTTKFENYFFTLKHDTDFNVEKMLSETEAQEILHDCDIVVVRGPIFEFTQHELKLMLCNENVNEFVEEIMRKHIALRQPDYLEAFDLVSNSYSELMYEMFITRRKVFDAYCEWLFSFVIDVTEEVLARSNMAESVDHRKYRAVGLIAERLLTVWLMKNNLRIKSLPIIFRKDI